MRQTLIFAICLACSTAEIIDRVAVTVDSTVITLSEIVLQLRVAAMLDDKPLVLDEAALREGADRLIEQAMVRREIALADYPAPGPEAADKALDDLKQTRFSGSAAMYRAALEKYGVTEEALRAQLLWQLTLLRFIEARFRPAVMVPTDEIRDYYRERFQAEWKERSNSPVPPMPRVREEIESKLVQERIANALERWLNQTRSQLRIVYRDQAFKQGAQP